MQYCTECGKAINMTDKFCSHCGAHLVSKDTSTDKTQEDKITNENRNVYLDEDGIPFKSKDGSKPIELDWINKDGNYKNPKFRQSKHKDKKNYLFINSAIVLAIIFVLYILVQVVGCNAANEKSWQGLLRIFQFDNSQCSCEKLVEYNYPGLKPVTLLDTFYGNDCL